MLHRILILSQGNATVESGFSVNESLLVENLKETSLVNQRIVADAVKLCGGPVNVPVTKQMLYHAGHARSRYRAHLDESKKKCKRERNSCPERKRLPEIRTKTVGKKKKAS